MITAVGLFSGGLDSMLAVKLMKAQGLAVEVLHFQIGFDHLRLRQRSEQKEAEVTIAEAEQQLGVTIQPLDVTAEFLTVVLNPEHGYGARMNPCIDCKIFMLRQAKCYLEAHAAQFVFTGEVVGQRPMTQHRHTMRHIEKASGLEGYLLRPLSAKLLDPTIPEQQGWVDREQLLGISGRGRNVQTELAQHYHLRYPQPAGGCLLTDPHFGQRLQDLTAHKPKVEIRVEDVELLKFGRHFRLSETVKVMVGRHELDNQHLEKYITGRWYAEVRDFQGPLVLIEGVPDEAQWEAIAQLTVRHSKAKDAAHATVDFTQGDVHRALTIVPNPQFQIEPWRI
jgi:tRNA-uridine 2-sulfurtransferase